MNSSYSGWKEIKVGVPQASVLEPLLFNIYINEIFMLMNRKMNCNYADHATIFACYPDLDTIVRELKGDAQKWFSDSYFKLSDDKCNLIVFGYNCTNATVTIGI